MAGLPKPVRVIMGIAGMALLVIIPLAVLSRYAGGWGVPYFSFTTERGSPCTNTLTGYTCRPLTLADVEFWAEVDLPDDTVVRDATYVSTHDYRLDAALTVPPASADEALASLNEAFGSCQKNRAAPMDTEGLKSVCVMSDETATRAGQATSRLWSVGTGLTADGNRPVVLAIRSR